MNSVYYGLSIDSASYDFQQQTVWCPTGPNGVHLSRKLTKRAVKQRAEKPIAASIAMIIEAEEWARRALAARGFGTA